MSQLVPPTWTEDSVHRGRRLLSPTPTLGLGATWRFGPPPTNLSPSSARAMRDGVPLAAVVRVTERAVHQDLGKQRPCQARCSRIDTSDSLSPSVRARGRTYLWCAAPDIAELCHPSAMNPSGTAPKPWEAPTA